MTHGGKRDGAGRRKGAKNKATLEREAGIAEITAQAKANGVTPLECMLGAMRGAWDKGDHEGAARFAKDAAPYVHPKLASIEHSGKDGKDLIPDAKPGDVAKAVLDILREAKVAAE